MILVAQVQTILKKYEPSCCSCFFKKPEGPQGVAELKNIIANMKPDSVLDAQQFFNFIVILNRKYETKESMEQHQLFLDLYMLIPDNERSAIKSLPHGPLFFNSENVAVMLQSKNPALFADVLKKLEFLALSYQTFVGGNYPLLGEQINALRVIASANSDDCSLQYNLILDKTKKDIGQKIGAVGNILIEHAYIEVEQERTMPAPH